MLAPPGQGKPQEAGAGRLRQEASYNHRMGPKYSPPPYAWLSSITRVPCRALPRLSESHHHQIRSARYGARFDASSTMAAAKTTATATTSGHRRHPVERRQGHHRRRSTAGECTAAMPVLARASTGCTSAATGGDVADGCCWGCGLFSANRFATGPLTCPGRWGVPCPFAGGCLPFTSPVAGLKLRVRVRRPGAGKNA
jgi:hypothetical protein